MNLRIGACVQHSSSPSGRTAQAQTGIHELETRQVRKQCWKTVGWTSNCEHQPCSASFTQNPKTSTIQIVTCTRTSTSALDANVNKSVYELHFETLDDFAFFFEHRRLSLRPNGVRPPPDPGIEPPDDSPSTALCGRSRLGVATQMVRVPIDHNTESEKHHPSAEHLDGWRLTLHRD